jgi:hypothetical protein
MSTPRANLDSPWKDILRTYLPHALQFFFPHVAATIDWQQPHEFLDTELQQISRDAAQGTRYADQLVKVWHHDGTTTWLLIHLEIQAQKDTQFPKRLYTYNFRIFDRFDRPAISLAILCDHHRT